MADLSKGAERAVHAARAKELLATLQNEATEADHAREQVERDARWMMWLRLVIQALSVHDGMFAQVSVPAGMVCQQVVAVLTQVRIGEERGRFAVRVGRSLTPEFVSLTVWAIHRDERTCENDIDED